MALLWPALGQCDGCPLAAMVCGEGGMGSHLPLPELSAIPLCLFGGICSCKDGCQFWFGLFGELQRSEQPVGRWVSAGTELHGGRVRPGTKTNSHGFYRAGRAQPCCIPINARDWRFLACPLNLSQLFQPAIVWLLNPPLIQDAASFYFIGSSDV